MFAVVVDVYMLPFPLRKSPAAKLATYVRNTVVETFSEICTEHCYDKTQMPNVLSATCFSQ